MMLSILLMNRVIEMPDDLLAVERRLTTVDPYLRRDHRSARLVYRARLVRSVFGRHAARLFMKTMRFDPALARRVAGAPESKLRR